MCQPFLLDAIGYCTDTLKLDKDELLLEMVNGIIGDYYPSPSRCLSNTETILNAFLEDTLYCGEKLSDSTKLFPTEGGTAAIAYLFESLSHNRLLKPDDVIAIATPIFTPYLEIPYVKDYNLLSIDVRTSAEDNWDIPDEELDFLNDLAARKGVVLMLGAGFDADEWTVRISLANLYEDDYKEIAARIFELLDEYRENI